MATLNLNIDARGAQTGAAQFTKSTDQVKRSAAQASASVGGMGTALNRMAQMSGAQRFVFQNTANQLGDIAVQASMGTNIFRVLGMQLPQVAGGFAMLGGSLGVVLPIFGVIAAVGFPIIAMFTSMGGAAEDTSDRIEALGSSIDHVKKLADLAATPIAKLSDEYGELAVDAKQAAAAIRNLELQQAARVARSLTAAILDERVALGDLEHAMRQLAAGSQGIVQQTMTGTTQAVIALRNELALTDEDAFKVMAQFQAIEQAADDASRAKGLLDLAELLETLPTSSEEGAESILILAQNAFSAGNEFAKINKLLKEISKESTKISRITITPRRGKSFYDEITAEDAETAKLKVLKILKERERQATVEALKNSKHEAKQFEIELDKVNLQMQTLQSAADMVGSSFERAFMGVIDGSMSVKDAFRSMAANIIAELYRIFIVKQITGFISGFIADPAMFGGLSGDGGAVRPKVRPMQEGGPINAGRAYLVGESGPELIVPRQAGTVIPNHELGGGVVVNQTINVSTGVQQTVRNEIQTLLPQIAEASKSAVLDARRRGGSFASAF